MLQFTKKTIFVITAAVVMIIFFALMMVLGWQGQKPTIIKTILDKEDWVVNLCEHLNEPATCKKVSTQKAVFLSEEQLRWWFDFQETIGQGAYNQDDYEKFEQMTPLIDRHAAKIIAKADPIGSITLGGSIYIFPRSRMSDEEINATLNKPKSQGSIIYDGAYPRVYTNVLFVEKPVSNIVVGARVVEPADPAPPCRSRTTSNLLVDMVQMKIIYVDMEYEYDADTCNKISP